MISYSKLNSGDNMARRKNVRKTNIANFEEQFTKRVRAVVFGEKVGVESLELMHEVMMDCLNHEDPHVKLKAISAINKMYSDEVRLMLEVVKIKRKDDVIELNLSDDIIPISKIEEDDLTT